jgi:Plasmid pRiA4b ORF-3-like protein
VLRIELDGVTPRVWRRVTIPSNTPLDLVHLMFQDAMGWHDQHLYAFETDEHSIIDPRSDSAGAAADGERLVSIATHQGATFAYTYDFGDEWTHTVTVEEIHPGGPDNTFTILALTTTKQSTGSAPTSTQPDRSNRAGQARPAWSNSRWSRGRRRCSSRSAPIRSSTSAARSVPAASLRIRRSRRAARW